MDKPMLLLILRMIARLVGLLTRIVEGGTVTPADVDRATHRVGQADDAWGNAHRKRKEGS